MPMHRLLIGTDSVLLDSYGAGLIGLSPHEVDYITMAASLGVGKLYSGSELIELNRAEQATQTFSLSRRAAQLTKNVKQDQACSACLGTLVHALNRLDQMGLLRRMPQPIFIGQGYRGKTADGLGIGTCCSGISCHVPGCPPQRQGHGGLSSGAYTVKQSIKLRALTALGIIGISCSGPLVKLALQDGAHPVSIALWRLLFSALLLLPTACAKTKHRHAFKTLSKQTWVLLAITRHLAIFPFSILVYIAFADNDVCFHRCPVRSATVYAVGRLFDLA